MKDAVRYFVLAVAAILVIAVLVVWKKRDRKEAFAELEARYGAEVSVTDDEFYIGCSSERLVDLVDFSKVVARAGDPTILDLTGAPNLESFDGVAKLLRLKSLIAIDCPKLAAATGVEKHPSLTELVLTDSSGFVDASAIRGLPSLDTLDLSGAEKLAGIDLSSLPNLKNLYLSRCRAMTSLDVSAVPLLRQLYLDGCAGIESLRGLESLTALTDLDVSNASSLESLAGVGKLGALIVLDIRNVELGDFTEIGTLPELRVLRMGGQSKLETLEPFSGLAGLREIHLEACPNFRSLKGLPATVSQYAGFTHCPSLESIDGVAAARGLEQLDLTGCENLEGIGPVASLEKLVQLSLVKCRKVQDITPVEKLENLVIVMLGGSGVVPAAVEELDPANEEIIFDFAVAE